MKRSAFPSDVQVAHWPASRESFSQVSRLLLTSARILLVLNDQQPLGVAWTCITTLAVWFLTIEMWGKAYQFLEYTCVQLPFLRSTLP